jgi:dTDP-4-amino-4,6-dideoxygalactose transaminase
LVSLKYVDQDNAYRRQLADWYDEHLADEPRIQPVPTAPGCVSSRHLYQVLVEHRDEVMLSLNQRQIFPGVHYRDNTHYKMYSQANGPCPNARRASDRVISLPMHLRLSFRDIRRVCEALKQAVSHHERSKRSSESAQAL